MRGSCRIGRLVFLTLLAAGLGHTAQAQPAKRVLYVTHVGPNAFAHPSRIYAATVLADLGAASGAFTVTTMSDASQLDGPTLATFDAVVFFTAGELPWTPVQKQAFLDYVRSGRGFVGVHSATDTFYQWAEYGDLIGAYYVNHPWTQAATIRVEDPTHVATAHLAPSFTITDEIYEVRNWSRSAVRVLLSLDTASVPPLGSRADNDYALAWTKSYGSGRVFYTALGHFTEVWDDVRFRQHVLGAIRWALGDGDGDGLDDRWETRYGLSESSAAGPNGAAGDPDGDGLTNAEEQAGGTHPRGFARRYLAEGAASAFFETSISVLNPNPSFTARVQLRFQRDTGSVDTAEVTLAPLSRRTIASPSDAIFSTLIESDVAVVADRTMTWGSGVRYGSHAESALAAPALAWYFAEGATHWNFDLFYLVQNPGATPAMVEATFLRAGAPAIARSYPAPAASRLTINVDAIPGLDAADVAAAFRSTNGTPVIVERAMYLSRPGELWSGGHASAGVTALATRWLLAEGATGTFFDTFVLVGNPGSVDVPLRVTYLRPDGQRIDRLHTVGAERRLTISPETEAPELAATSLSVVVESLSGAPIVVERAMWWPGPGGPSWYEGHATLGTTETGSAWATADALTGGAGAARTYVLVATGDGPPVDSLRVSAIRDGGPPIVRLLADALRPNARLTLDVGALFPELAGERVGLLVESVGQASGQAAVPMPLVVERAMYADAGGPFWSQGSNLIATRLR